MAEKYDEFVPPLMRPFVAELVAHTVEPAMSPDRCAAGASSAIARRYRFSEGVRRVPMGEALVV